MPMFEIEQMRMRHYDAVIALWKATPGVGLGGADTRACIRRYLRRNPGLSFVASRNGQLIGAALCGHDGRRGYIYHLAVAEEERRKGIGRALTEACLSGLAKLGIGRCHILVFAANTSGRRFWRRIGWRERRDVLWLTRDISAPTPRR